MPEVAVKITGEEQVSQAFKKAEQAGKRSAETLARAWDKTGQRMKAAGERINQVGAGITKLSAPVALLGGAAVKMAADFETSLTNVSTLIKGDAGPAVAELEAGVKSLLERVPKNADELGTSLYAIYSAGINEASGALKTLEASSKLAVAGLGSTQEATNLTTVAIKAFGLDAEEADKHVDVLFKTVKNGITTVSALSTNFGQLAGQASAIDVRFEDMQAATAALTAVTGKTAQSQTQLAALFREVGEDGGALDKELQKMKVTSKDLRDAIREKGVGGGLEFMRDKLKLSNEEMKNLFSSSEASFAAFSLLTSANETYNDTLDDMLHGTNAINEAFEKQKATANATWQIMKNKVTVALIDLGDKILPKLLPLVEDFGDLIGRLSDRFSKLSPGMQSAVLAVGALVAAAGPAILILGSLVTSIGAIVSGIGAAAAAIGVSVSGLLLPIAAIGAAIALLTVAWAKNWGDIRGKAQAALEFIQPMLNDVKAAFNVVVEDIKAAWDKISPTVMPVLEEIWSLMQKILPPMLELFKAVMGGIWKVIKAGVGQWYILFKTAVATLWEILKPIVELAGIFLEFINDALNILSSEAEFAEKGRALMVAFGSAIKAAANVPIEAVKGIVGRIRNLLPSSDAKEGPLSDLTASGKAFSETMALGIAQKAIEMEKATKESLARLNQIIKEHKLPPVVKAEDLLREIELEEQRTTMMLEQQRKRAEALASQREFDNLSRLEQLRTRMEEELLLLDEFNVRRDETERYWRDLIAEEEARIAEENAARRAEEQEAQLAQFNAFGQNLQNSFTTAMQGVLAQEQTMGEALRNIVTNISKALIEQMLKQAIAAIWAAAARGAKDIWSGAAAMAAGAAMVGVVKGKFAALADGGLVRGPMFAQLGEAGPELVTPLNQVGGLGMGPQKIFNLTVNNSYSYPPPPEQARQQARDLLRYIEEEQER